MQTMQPDTAGTRDVVEVPYSEFEAYLDKPDSRIRDMRIIEYMDDFTVALQVLGLDEKIYQTCVDSPDALKLFRLQYKHNRRNNPGLYGLLDRD